MRGAGSADRTGGRRSGALCLSAQGVHAANMRGLKRVRQRFIAARAWCWLGSRSVNWSTLSASTWSVKYSLIRQRAARLGADRLGPQAFELKCLKRNRYCCSKSVRKLGMTENPRWVAQFTLQNRQREPSPCESDHGLAPRSGFVQHPITARAHELVRFRCVHARLRESSRAEPPGPLRPKEP